MDFNKIANFLGMIGTSGVIVSYFLIQIRKMKATGIAYSLINTVASVFLLFSLYYTPNLPSIIIEVFWLIISVIGVYNYFYKK